MKLDPISNLIQFIIDVFKVVYSNGWIHMEKKVASSLICNNNKNPLQQGFVVVHTSLLLYWWIYHSHKKNICLQHIVHQSPQS